MSRTALAAFVAVTALAALGVLAGLGYQGVPVATAQYGPPAPPQRVTICHHANFKSGTKHVTLRVRRSFVRGHLRHGDTLGACTTNRNKLAHKKPAHAKKFHKKRR